MKKVNKILFFKSMGCKWYFPKRFVWFERLPKKKKDLRKKKKALFLPRVWIERENEDQCHFSFVVFFCKFLGLLFVKGFSSSSIL